ncbi:MAG: ribulose-phosphate 3-epimerase [Thermoleophilia bacterium]|nr:ribulose-phosphate 3-epimerase [Thermoleophilia bacterium]
MTDRNDITLGASVLAADWSRMGDELAALEAAGCDYVHWDVMDNRYVPNMSFSWDMIAACRKSTNMEFEVHLMAHRPERDIQKYVDAGCTRIVVHAEACQHVLATLQMIRTAGASAGLALNPGTPIDTLDDLWPFLDTVLLMLIAPGFGGQQFEPALLPKIERTRRFIDEHFPGIRLEVDGGMKPTNVDQAVAAGARAIVCGSGLFGPEGKTAAVAAMKAGMTAGVR